MMRFPLHLSNLVWLVSYLRAGGMRQGFHITSHLYEIRMNSCITYISFRSSNFYIVANSYIHGIVGLLIFPPKSISPLYLVVIVQPPMENVGIFSCYLTVKGCSTGVYIIYTFYYTFLWPLFSSIWYKNRIQTTIVYMNWRDATRGVWGYDTTENIFTEQQCS